MMKIYEYKGGIIIQKYDITVELNIKSNFKIMAKNLKDAKEKALEEFADYELTAKGLDDRSYNIYESSEKNFSYDIGLETSKNFIDNFKEELEIRGIDCKAYIEPFYNDCISKNNNHIQFIGKEQGYVLIIYGKNDVKEDLYIWSCCPRSSDDIKLVFGTRENQINNVYNKSCQEKIFNSNAYKEAVDYAMEQYQSWLNKSIRI